MNVMQARTIAEKIAELKAISAAFAAAYGTDYRLSADSPAQSIDMYRRSMGIQAVIASKLNPKALSGAYSRYGKWWKTHDMMPSAIVNEMATAVFELIGQSAYGEDKETGSLEAHQTLVLEQSIAGMLHPSTLISELHHEDDKLEGIS